MIEATGLVKAYRTSEVETTALDGVDLSIGQGEFVSIMGPSGCGKSTLLSVLGMIELADGGRYSLDGLDVSRLAERRRAAVRRDRLGFVFQSYNLIDDLTVFENVELPLVYARNRSAKERRFAVEEMLAKVNMGHRVNHFPKQLSGGQQQRVAIARALVNNPALLLADEPTGNLDSENGRDVLRLLLDLKGSGATVVMVTHSQQLAGQGDRVVRMLDGRITSSLPPTR